jgi:PAS domain S-box-containing protein
VASNGALFLIEASRLPHRASGLQAALITQLVFYVAAAALLARAVSLATEALDLANREANERRAVEAALRDSVERYRLITTVSSDYVFSTVLQNDTDLRLNWVAGAFERISGYGFDEYVARGGWRAALHPDDVEQDNRDIKTLRENRPVVSELRTIRKDGSVCWVRVYAHPVWDDAGQRVQSIYGAVQDISERKVADAEREGLIQELESRNAELERFTYTVSHDLKSPLITIRGFLGHVEQAALEGRIEDVRADMDRIYKSTAKMHRLLDDLLELSRVGRLAKAPEDIPYETIVRDALDRAHGRLNAQKVVVEVQPDLPTVSVDRDRLVEVVQNLVDNAAKFSIANETPRIWIGFRDTASERAFFVRDNGAGIEPKHHERIFNLFDKLDPKSPGTGVGLALARRIVEVHGGRIWVESEGAGHGSTFLFTLGGALPPGTPPPNQSGGVH